MSREYYYETATGFGKFHAPSDDDALNRLMRIRKVMVCYRESDTPNGLPFVIIHEPFGYSCFPCTEGVNLN
jgi:hypothetical protein